MHSMTNLLSAGTLTGDKVKNHKGDDLGKVEELMIDAESGRIEYAVLSFGGFLGVNNKLFAVPWQSLKVDRAEKCLRLNAEKEQLESAPGFDKDHWPNMADPQWYEPVRGYYEKTLRPVV